MPLLYVVVEVENWTGGTQAETWVPAEVLGLSLGGREKGQLELNFESILISRSAVVPIELLLNEDRRELVTQVRPRYISRRLELDGPCDSPTKTKSS